MKRKNQNIILVMIIISLLMIPLSGCQLAVDDNVINRKTEALYGVFVTMGPVKTYGEINFDSVNVNNINSKNMILNEKDWSSFNINRFEGVLLEDGRIQFEGVDGYYMGIFQIEDPMGNKSNSTVIDPGFIDKKTTISIIDGSEELFCESTLSVGPDYRDTIYINPVFKRGDGTYFTTVGESMGFMLTGESTGQIYSETLDSTITQSLDETSHYEKVSFKVNIAVVDVAEQIWIKEMTEADDLIKTTEYFREDPAVFIVNPNTKYIIVEEIMRTALEGNYVKRSIYSLDDTMSFRNRPTHTCYYTEDKDIVSMKTLQFEYVK